MSNKEHKRNFEKLIEVSKNNDHTTGNLLDYKYFSKHYNLIAMKLSKKIEILVQNNKLILLVNLIKAM